MDADVVIVGGGGHGLATAYYLAKEHGLTNVAVLEKNWGSRAKLVLESNFICSQQLNNPWTKGVNVLAELNYLLTYHLSLRTVGFYFHSVNQGRTYEVRNISGGLSCRF